MEQWLIDNGWAIAIFILLIAFLAGETRYRVWRLESDVRTDRANAINQSVFALELGHIKERIGDIREDLKHVETTHLELNRGQSELLREIAQMLNAQYRSPCAPHRPPDATDHR